MDMTKYAASETNDLKAIDFKGRNLKVVIENVEVRHYDARNGQAAQDKAVLRFIGKEVFDTMREWAGWKGYVSQTALCEAFGIDVDTDLDGSMVWDAYQRKKYDDILTYNKNDVRIVRELYKRMIWQ